LVVVEAFVALAVADTAVSYRVSSLCDRIGCSTMSQVTEEERFRRWYVPWRERICEDVRSFSHGTVLRSARYPDSWECNCLRLDRPLKAGAMIAAADRELVGCPHRFVEWLIPVDDGVLGVLRERGWVAAALVFLLHDGRELAEGDGELVEVDYDEVRELRDIWHREDFGAVDEPEAFPAQARQVAELADVRVFAAIREGHPIGFAQVETHDGGSEVSQVFVRPERRGAGVGGALTARAIRAGAEAAPDVWICAERDDRPRRLYEQLGFRVVAETGVAILLPKR
jgi:ribosomal protein S18 acetylase RimI-like enzyme